MAKTNYTECYKRNLSLAIPVMIAQAGQMVVQLADNIMVGHLGTNELAGVSFAGNIILIGFVFFLCYSQGSTPLIGQAFGRGDCNMVRKWYNLSFVMNTIVGALVILLMAVALPLLGKMGQDPSILGYAKEYYWISLVSIIPTIFFFSIKNFSEGIGITKYAMYITLATNLLNVLLNWLLIFGKAGFPQMGVSGAAVATLISRTICFLVFWAIIHKFKSYRRFIDIKGQKNFTLQEVKRLFTTSISIGLQGLCEVTAFSLCAIMAGWLGKETLAGYQITNIMCTLSFVIAEGLGVAATISVSHHYGKGDIAAARRSGIAATHLSIIFMCSAGLLYSIFRENIPYIFTADRQVAILASQMLIVAAIFQLFDATQMAGYSSLRGLGDVKIPSLYTFMAYYILGLPIGFITCFKLGCGAPGIWTGLAIGLMTMALLNQIRFRRLTNRLEGR